MKIQVISKKFNIFLDILMCSFIWTGQKQDIYSQKKLRKILGIQPKYESYYVSHNLKNPRKFKPNQEGLYERPENDFENSEYLSNLPGENGKAVWGGVYAKVRFQFGFL